jgi:Cu2+-exporting ATPase
MDAAGSGRDWSVYDRPELRDTISLAGSRGCRELLLSLDGVHCASCVARVDKILGEFGARGRINLTAKTAEIEWSPQRAPLSAILRRLDHAGYVPRVLAQTPELLQPADQQRQALTRIGIAALGSMQVMMLAWPAYFHADMEPAIAMMLRFAQWLFATPVVIYAGWPFFLSAWRASRDGMINMDVPVALALAVAYLVSAWRTVSGAGDIYYDTATMFVLLLSIGRYFEGRTRALASQRLRALAGRRTLTATRLLPDGSEQTPVSALRVDDRIIVSPGDAVPVDGVVINDPAELDESLLTGEARPVRRAAGARALAGSVNVGRSAFTLRVSATGSATRLSQIAHLLNRAQSERPPFALLADRISGSFIAFVLLLATAAAWYWWDAGADVSLSVALAVLVASCPCALALAVPAAYAAATSRLAAEGVLVVHPQALARLGKADTVIFDKTGTLTRNDFELCAVQAASGQDADRCQQLAAALELGGIHPIARAFAHQPTSLRATGVEQQHGGVSGTVEGQRYWLGAPEHCAQPLDGGWIAARMAEHPQLTWIVLSAGQPLALFGLGAVERPEAAATVRCMEHAGLQVQLLSGDGLEAVGHLARRLGISSFAARQTPEQKLARLQGLQAQGSAVIAIGDGVNDAPLLGAADVAIVMPAGAALAQSSADAILIGDSLRGLPLLLEVGARTEQLIRQNIAWALLYNLAVLPLAAANLLHPWLAALGMSLSSLLVVGNSLRVVSRKTARKTSLGPALEAQP